MDFQLDDADFMSADVSPQLPDSVEVPATLDTLPDGRPTVIIGDVSGYAEFNHQQGQNDYGFDGDCGLCSCGDVLNQFGVDATEADVVDGAVKHGDCAISDDPEKAGGTTEADQVRVLADWGIPAHVEQHQSLEDLATDVEHGHGVIVEANAGYLWNDAQGLDHGQANHAVCVTGVARDPQTGEVQGFYINDSGDGQSAKFVDANTMTKAWVDTGGSTVVTDVVHTGSAALTGV